MGRILATERLNGFKPSEKAEPLTLRPATRADWQPVADLITSVRRELGLGESILPADCDLKNIEKSYQEPGGNFLILEAGGEVLGCGGLFPRSTGTAELRRFCLHPSLRGKGIGRRFLSAFVLGAAERGFFRLEVETNPHLAAANHLFHSAGFRRASRRCDHPLFTVTLAMNLSR